MEELVKNCITYFLDDMKEKGNRYKIIKKTYLFIKTEEDKDYFNYIKNWMFFDCIEDINNNKYNDIEKEFFNIVLYYYKVFYKKASNYFTCDFFCKDFSFMFAKGIIELYCEYEFKGTTNYFKEINNNSTYSNIFKENEYLLSRILVQDKICEDVDFLKICDKLTLDDLIRNINQLENINIEALYQTLLITSSFKNKSCLFVYSMCVVCYSVRSSIYHYGFLKEEPENFDDLF